MLICSFYVIVRIN